MFFLASPSPQAQEGLFVWAPRGDANEEEQKTRIASRRPGDLRPLTSQDEDGKSVAGILNQSILPMAVSSCSVLHRGLLLVGSCSEIQTIWIIAPGNMPLLPMV